MEDRTFPRKAGATRGGLVRPSHEGGPYPALVERGRLPFVMVPATPVLVIPATAVPVRRASLEIYRLGRGDVRVRRVVVVVAATGISGAPYTASRHRPDPEQHGCEHSYVVHGASTSW